MCAVLIHISSYLHAVPVSKIIPRSQSFNAARDLVGWDNPYWGINRKPSDSFYSSLNLVFEYTQTFRGNDLLHCLFGDDLICECGKKNALRITSTASGNNYFTFFNDISGKEIPVASEFMPDRLPNDWLADYFGLPLDYCGIVTFDPKIDNFILDFNVYLGLDNIAQGMYFKIHGPFVHTQWTLGAREQGSSSDVFSDFFGVQYAPGYVSPDSIVDKNKLNRHFLDFTSGYTPSIDGVTWQALCCSRINNDCVCDPLTRNGFGELRFILGWNFLNNEDGYHHLGTGLYVAAPTGNRLGDSPYLFEPIIGNGKYWEVGAQITAHRIWWHNEAEDKSFATYLEANITHFLSAHQTRCFDLCGKPNSRYMLAYRLQSNARSYQTLDASVDSLGLEYANELAPVANITRRAITSRIDVQGDVALSFAYQSEGFQWDIGYNFWGRSCEKICLRNDCCPYNVGDWALKGTMFTYGFDVENNQPVALAATDSRATINASTRNTNPTNMFADNSVQALSDGDFVLKVPPFIPSPPAPAPINLGPFIRFFIYQDGINDPDLVRAFSAHTSETPVLINLDNLDLTGTRGISHKLFTHFNWVWKHREDSDWIPYIGLGGEIEFGRTEKACCPSKDTTANDPLGEQLDCGLFLAGCIQFDDYISPYPTPNKASKSCCVDCAISQWGVWFKVGASR